MEGIASKVTQICKTDPLNGETYQKRFIKSKLEPQIMKIKLLK